MPVNPFASLAAMGITSVEELQGLIALFGFKQRDPSPPLPSNMQPEPQPGPSTPHWNNNQLVDNMGNPINYLLPTAADRLTRDYSQGTATGKRNAGTNYRP